ncbi:ubiA prenyltransferase family domain-containing protein [Ditylenchus destructor]|nr:ubiA prenyltransferase family domain-containing protein [Ditylenchus destructor]
MLLANRFCVRLCRPPNLSYKYYAPQTIERFASALPRARPNKDEIVRDETDTVGAATIELRKIMVPSIETTMKPRINDTEDSKIEVTSVAANVENQRWKKMTPNNLIGVYLQLSKDRLTMMITASTACGFLISGVPISWPAFGACLAGTALLSASANTCNHLLEAPYDAQMKRTQSRALVIHRISPLHAFAFANATAAVGLGFLCLGCNSLTSGLGLLNLVIYACLYTPMKRYHIGCTWVGAINGVIPPLMGYTAATGRLDMAALTLGAILFSWQFPHFNALSWNLRGDYSRAGYQVMCVTNEELCRKTTLRHAFALMGLCSVVAPLTNLGTPSFALASLPLNLAMVYYSYKFYRQPDSQSAKALFRCSTFVYLPLIMVLFRKSATKMHSNSNTSVSSGSSRGRSGRHRPKRAVIPIKKAQESEVSDSNEEIKQRELDSAKGEGQLADNKEELMESTEGENATDTSHQNLQLTSNPSLEEGKDTVSENASDQIMSDLAEDGAIVAAASDTAPAHNVIPDESVGLSQLKDELEVAENRAVDTNEVAEQENPKAEIEPEVELKDDLSNMPEAEQKMSVSTKDSSEEDKLNDSKPVEKVSNDGESVSRWTRSCQHGLIQVNMDGFLRRTITYTNNR